MTLCLPICLAIIMVGTMGQAAVLALDTGIRCARCMQTLIVQ